MLAWERDVFGDKVAPATEAAGQCDLLVSRVHRQSRSRRLAHETSTAHLVFLPATYRWNRPGILIETHMIKDYRSRVIGTYDFLRAALTEVNRDPERLRRSDAKQTSARSLPERVYDPDVVFPLDFELTDEATPFQSESFQLRDRAERRVGRSACRLTAASLWI